MKPASDPSPLPAPRLEPFLLGTAMSLISSLAYSCANVCLRWVAESDPLLVSCVKAVPTLLIATTIVAVGAARGRTRWPSPRAFIALIVVGVISQLGGNALFQWSLGQVGLALTVPLCSGATIIGSVLLARIWLGEGVSPRSVLALALLIAAIVVLSVGAERAPQKAEIATATASITLALFGACFSGVSYAALSVVIRRLVTGSTQMPVVLATITSAGVVSLGAGSILHIGWKAMSETPHADLGVMLLAGLFNAVGFFALTKALQLVSIVQVNAVSASQSALAALAGVAVFGESFTVSLTCGVALTILGLALVDRARKIHGKPRDADADFTAASADDEAIATPELQLPDAAALPREPTAR